VNLKIHALNVGHGDSLIVQLPNGSNGVIDYNRCKERTDLLRFLTDKLGVSELLFVCLTHPHSDHLSGLEKLLKYYEAQGRRVKEFWYSDFNLPSTGYQDLIEYVAYQYENYGEPVPRIVRAGEVMTMGEIEIKCLAPPQDYPTFPHDIENPQGSEVNNSIIVFQIRYSKVWILLGGDAEEESWNTIRNIYSIPIAKAIKISHHGSVNGSPIWLIDKFRTTKAYGVISEGQPNSYGLPDSIVVHRWRESIKSNHLLITQENEDVSGQDILIQSDGHHVRLEKVQ
jgi:beta-lactamase superfamily II metal-dependent hydrolase